MNTHGKVVSPIEQSGAMSPAEVISQKVVNEDEEAGETVHLLRPHPQTKAQTFDANTIFPQLLSKSGENSEECSGVNTSKQTKKRN